MNPMGNSPAYGFSTSWGGHSFNWIFPEDCKTIDEYFKKYPEQFALNNGIRVINQHCYTNPDTVKTFLNWIDNFWKNHPEIEYLTLPHAIRRSTVNVRTVPSMIPPHSIFSL